MSKINIRIEAATVSEAVASVVDSIDTAALITVLSKRLEANGRLLMIHEKGDDVASTANVAKPTEPASTKTKPAAAKPAAAKPAAAAAKPADTADADASGGDWAEDAASEVIVEGADAGKPAAAKINGDGKYSMQDVRAKLDVFRANHGLVTARQIMVEAGGSSKLVDIPAAKYGALIAALDKHTVG